MSMSRRRNVAERQGRQKKRESLLELQERLKKVIVCCSVAQPSDQDAPRFRTCAGIVC